MATPKHATLIANEPAGDGARRLTFKPEEPMKFVGGKFVIVDTGIEIEPGKNLKRAWSIASSDSEPDTFSLVLQQIEGGQGVTRMHAAETGERFSFSGPWGKFTWPDTLPDTPALVIATDTGATAAAGLMQAQHRGEAHVLWLRSDTGFEVELDADIRPLAPVKDPNRIDQARGLLLQCLMAETPSILFLCGDGDVVTALAAVANEHGLEGDRLRTEIFFNKPAQAAT